MTASTQSLQPRKARKELQRIDFLLLELVKSFLRESDTVKKALKEYIPVNDIDKPFTDEDIALAIADVYREHNHRWQVICNKKWKYNKCFPAAFDASVKQNLNVVPLKPKFNINELIKK